MPIVGYCGPMFSGKSTALLRAARHATIARKALFIAKPRIDSRYAADSVVSHDLVSTGANLFNIDEEGVSSLAAEVESSHARVFCFDEVQFFHSSLVDVVMRLSDRGADVYWAGLDMDARRIPFGPVPQLMAISDEVHRLRAVCTVCGGPATLTHKKTGDGRQIDVGAADKYTALCHPCWLEANR